jgi:periplasmic protein TonB
VPVPILPEIQLASPPPRETIAIPPPPVAAPSVPDAPLAPPAPAFDPTGDAQKAFVARLFAHLNRFKQYPQGARLRHEQGVVGLRFTMDRQGRVLSFTIAKNSGSKLLDEEALNIIKRAQPLPRIPAAFPQTQLDLVIPVEFSLR